MATRADGDLKQVITQANLLERKTNIKGRVTLIPNATKTVVTELQMGFGSAAALCPMTANAAAELASGGCFISEYGPGNFTITHRNSAQTDRKFAYGVWI